MRQKAKNEFNISPMPEHSTSLLELKIERPAYGGIFIARHDGKIVMVKGALLPGETAEVLIESEKKDYLTGRVEKIIGPSPDRIEPECKYFGICGGCHYQHIPYELQVRLKEEILRDCLKRMGKIEMDLSEPIVGDKAWGYRLRGQFKVRHDKIGFYREGTREIVDIDSCPLMTDGLNSYFQKIREAIDGLYLKEVHITLGDNAVALIKPASDCSREGRKRISRAFREAGFSGFAIETIKNKTYQYGKNYVTLDVDGMKYTVSASSFFQSNWSLNKKLLKVIKDHSLPKNPGHVLDLYAGAGNFSFPFSTRSLVTAVEENPSAIEDGNRNIGINEIFNFKFMKTSAEKFNLKSDYDLLILDPPRPGVTRKVMDKVLYRTPENIIYISCNPTTFARDLGKLKNRYSIDKISMIDFFPQTYHIESIAFLKKNYPY